MAPNSVYSATIERAHFLVRARCALLTLSEQPPNLEGLHSGPSSSHLHWNKHTQHYVTVGLHKKKWRDTHQLRQQSIDRAGQAICHRRSVQSEQHNQSPPPPQHQITNVLGFASSSHASCRRHTLLSSFVPHGRHNTHTHTHNRPKNSIRTCWDKHNVKFNSAEEDILWSRLRKTVFITRGGRSIGIMFCAQARTHAIRFIIALTECTCPITLWCV